MVVADHDNRACLDFIQFKSLYKKCNRERHLAYLDVIYLINNILKGVNVGIEVDTTSTPFCVRSFVRNLSILMKQLFRNMP